MKLITKSFAYLILYSSLIVITNTEVLSQVSEGGLPVSFRLMPVKKEIIIPVFNLKTLDFNKYIKEDSLNGIENRYSIFEKTSINVKEGLKTIIEQDNGQIWRQKIVANGAKSIQLVFSRFYLPEGARLFIYDTDHSQVYGAYTDKNNQTDSSFVVADFIADQLIVEYFEPFTASFPGIIEIGAIGQAYRDVIHEEQSINNYIDINCFEGRDWQTEKHAVCKITYKIGLQGYICSGSLINNAKNDLKPYFLTANHCIDSYEMAKTVVAYFNYEKKGCSGNVKAYKTLSGATLLSKGSESDYSLLLFDNTPDSSYVPYYAGWDISDTVTAGYTCIHHPRGFVKKISIDYDKIDTYPEELSWDDGPMSAPNSHWITGIDDGRIAGGSSGAPLFNSKKRIVGQLHGGTSYNKYFGKLSYSFLRPDSGFMPLRTFLDPDNTGILTLDGFSDAKNSPDAYFFSDFTQVCTNAEIKFTDQSAFSSTRVWQFNPSTVTYVNGTDSTSKYPWIRFNLPGDYSVKLQVAGESGNDELTVNNFIHTGDKIQVGIDRPGKNAVCFYEFDSLVIATSGAQHYFWSFPPDIDPYFSKYDISDNMKVLKLKNNDMIDSSFKFTTVIIGEHGTCKDTTDFNFRIVKTFNDNVESALPLVLGENGPYANYCATVETNEPMPPIDSCTGQMSWCDELHNGHGSLKNSVWFYFYGPLTGKIFMKSDGFNFDNQLAIYDAVSSEDIINGHALLLAANDDYSDNNTNPEIYSLGVQPGKKYWVQIDGSGGGTYGQFYLYLFDSEQTTGILSNPVKNSLNIYPQPASDYIFVSSDEIQTDNKLTAEIYSIEGKLLYNQQFSQNREQFIKLNTDFLSAGIYLIRLHIDNKMLTGKFIK